ncbi:alpha-1,3-mannosyltransferase family protein [Flavobacterium sp. 7A]|uniref:alpha-1,3-mannosyltransferase family protein n=1 Tax=Flavobacterium sp. 7A TaxID=2940571 RepID=UPI0022278296|nr:alpha-1,3-mannosyltransferase family protein [Flavobacterium sp. 7A]MCW2118491.1 putative secreted protein [Flavobacterium sp. 7A]
MKKGIVLVANLKSQWYAENLIYSIRKSGCSLPIRLIHFGGEAVNSKYILKEVEFLTIDDFPEEAKDFINNLRTVLTDCPMGFLYRFLAWFSDWDEFIYTDNDIVALMDWERLFDYSANHDLVHADEEYTTQGIYNYDDPQKIEEIFGMGSLSTAITAGHLLVKKNDKMIGDMNAAVAWFHQHPSIPKKHDQSLLHIAALLGNWKVLNLCKSPHNWLSSWSGDYKNSLDLIQAIQGVQKRPTDSFNGWYNTLSVESKNSYNLATGIAKPHISHLHYSGRGALGAEPIDELMFSSHTDNKRMRDYFKIEMADLLLISSFKKHIKRIKRHLNR